MAILHQRVTHVRQLRFEAMSLLGQACFWVSRALVRSVRALLTSEVDRWVTRIIRRRIRGWLVLRPKALQAGGSLDQRAVDRKVLVRKQPQTVSLSDHLIEELQRDLLLQQATAVFAECGLVEARLHQAHVEEPTPQQLEIQFF